jgi:AcrR family transcriptional regulator
MAAMNESTHSGERPLRADARRNRELILDAAGEVFAEQGLDASLDLIAERAGVGVGTVYRRFPDKNSLIDELFEDRLAEFVGVAEEAVAMEDAWDGLVHFITRASELHGNDCGLRELVFGGGLDRAMVSRPLKTLPPMLESMIERAKADGRLREDFEVLDIPMIEMMLSSLIELTPPRSPEFWKRMLTVVLDGMRADRTPGSGMDVPPMTPQQYMEAMAYRAGRDR